MADVCEAACWWLATAGAEEDLPEIDGVELMVEKRMETGILQPRLDEQRLLE